MLRGLHSKLVMIMVLLILSLMMVVGAFLVNSVVAFYLNSFYGQMSNVFQDERFVSALTTETEGEEDGAQKLYEVLLAYSGDLGVDSRGNRDFYILDGNSYAYLAGTNDDGSTVMEYTRNLTTALETGKIGDQSSPAAKYMDVAVPIQRGTGEYVIYIRDNKADVDSLTSEIVLLIVEALIFGLAISVLLSFLLAKTMITPIQRLTEGTIRVAKGDFSHKLQVTARDEIGVLTETFNDMAGQLRRTIRQVENERNKLGTLFRHMTDGVVAFAPTGMVIHSNPAAEVMLCRTIDERTSYDQLFGDVAPLESALAAPDFLEVERRVGERHLELLLAPFDRQSQGGVLVVLHDVTEHRRNEELRREFVANVSHELRTPLTNIRSYAETLVDSSGDIPPTMQKKFLGVIQSESDRMTHIVQDLLTLSRFDSGYDKPRLLPFSFADAVSDVYHAIYLEAQKHGHTFRLAVEAGLPQVMGERERIVQVMMNITSNAIKYTPDGGTILVSAGRSGDRVWMQVDDNGLGIPQEDRPRIFERFYRVDKARSRQSGGTGLGLSIALEIVKRHQGDLFIVDREGPGLTVRMELDIQGPEHD